MIRKHWLSIMVGVLAAGVTSIASSVWLAQWMGLSTIRQKGLAVRSVSTKAQQLGEMQGVVAALVMMMAGLFNVLAAPLIRQIFF